MDKRTKTEMANLVVEFAETDIERLLTKIYDYYFAPRSIETRSTADKEIAKALKQYQSTKDLPLWVTQALKNKQRTTHSDSEADEHNIADAIEKVLDSNKSFIAALTDSYTFWAHGIPILWMLVFIEVYGEFPKNKPGTRHHYTDGVTDDRWESLLNKQDAADNKTGYRYMLEAIELRGIKP